MPPVRGGATPRARRSGYVSRDDAEETATIRERLASLETLTKIALVLLGLFLAAGASVLGVLVKLVIEVAR